MRFLITADGFKPFVLHLNNLKQNNWERAGVKLSLIADQGTASQWARFFQVSFCKYVLIEHK